MLEPESTVIAIVIEALDPAESLARAVLGSKFCDQVIRETKSDEHDHRIWDMLANQARFLYRTDLQEKEVVDFLRAIDAIKRIDECMETRATLTFTRYTGQGLL